MPGVVGQASPHRDLHRELGPASTTGVRGLKTNKINQFKTSALRLSPDSPCDSELSSATNQNALNI